MKTITIDFETYKDEIILAKQAGAYIGKSAIEKIRKIFAAFNAYDKDALHIAKMELLELMNKLENAHEFDGSETITGSEKK